jgi:hypothetical protein
MLRKKINPPICPEVGEANDTSNFECAPPHSTLPSMWWEERAEARPWRARACERWRAARGRRCAWTQLSCTPPHRGCAPLFAVPQEIPRLGGGSESGDPGTRPGALCGLLEAPCCRARAARRDPPCGGSRRSRTRDAATTSTMSRTLVAPWVRARTRRVARRLARLLGDDGPRDTNERVVHGAAVCSLQLHSDEHPTFAFLREFAVL